MPKQQTEIIKKHASAIHVDAKLSIIQRKLSNALLFNAYENLLSQKKHRVDIPTLCSLIGFDSKNTSYIKEALLDLTKISIQWNVIKDSNEEIWEASTLLAGVKIDNNSCTYEYYSGLAEKLYNPEMYARINLAVQRRISSGYALTLYENCFRFLRVKSTGWWTLNDFRKIMGVNEEEYYKTFKRLSEKIIRPSIKEINKTTNIFIEAEYMRSGRRISAIRFSVKENPQLSMLDMEEGDEVNQTIAYKRCLKKGIGKLLARQWVLDKGEKYVLEKLDHTDKMEGAGRIKATASGFLTKAIQQDYKTEEAVNKERKAEVDKKRSEETEQEQELDRLSKQLRGLERAYRGECTNLIEARFSAMSEAEQNEVRESFKDVLSGHAIALQRFVKDGWKSPLSSVQAREFWSEKYTLPFPIIEDFAKDQGIKNLKIHKQKIRRLETKL